MENKCRWHIKIGYKDNNSGFPDYDLLKDFDTDGVYTKEGAEKFARDVEDDICDSARYPYYTRPEYFIHVIEPIAGTDAKIDLVTITFSDSYCNNVIRDSIKMDDGWLHFKDNADTEYNFNLNSIGLYVIKKQEDEENEEETDD